VGRPQVLTLPAPAVPPHYNKDTMYVPSPPVHLVTANGSRTVVELRGDAHVVTSYGGIETMIVLKNAMYVPNCAHVLISGSLAHDAGLRQDLTSGVMKTSTGEIISRLGFHKSRVLVLEGASYSQSRSPPSRGPPCRREVCDTVDRRRCAVCSSGGALQLHSTHFQRQQVRLPLRFSC
jgi:hypothetical protein